MQAKDCKVTLKVLSLEREELLDLVNFVKVCANVEGWEGSGNKSLP